MHIHMCVCMHECMDVCMYNLLHTCVCTHAIYICIDIYIHICVYIYVCDTYIRILYTVACIYIHVPLYIYACLCACMYMSCAITRVSTSTCIHVYIFTSCTSAYIRGHICTRASANLYMQLKRHTYVQLHLHTYMFTFAHVHLQICTCS